MSDAELNRLRTEYRQRGAAGAGPYRWDNAGYVSYMQAHERSLLRGLSDAGVDLAGARVLDVGCGSGYFLHRLREYGAGECHGIDLVVERIAVARDHYPTLEFHVGDAGELPFNDSEFDLVTQFTCLSSILDDEMRFQTAQEMRRVARGGWLLSFDLRRKANVALVGGTPTVALDERELTRLFGTPKLLRRAGLTFDLAQLLGRHDLLARALATLPLLRSHLLGFWRVAA